MQADYSWSYPATAPAPLAVVAAPAPVPWVPPPAPLGGGFKADLHTLDTGSEPTFHDEVAGLFENDALLFADGEEWHGAGASGADILGLGVAEPLAAPVAAGAPAPVAAVPVAVPEEHPSILECADDDKLAAEASGSGSGEASADGFTLPPLGGEQVSAPPLGGLGGATPYLGAFPGAEEDEDEEEEEEEGPQLMSRAAQQQQQQQQIQQQPTPLSSSGYSAGLAAGPTTSRGQVSVASALGKRPGGELDAAVAAGKRSARRRVPSKRAAAAYDESSDEEYDDAQYRSSMRRAAAAAAAAGAQRASTRLQGRPSAPFRLDSDYVTYDDIIPEEPVSPAAAAVAVAGAAPGIPGAAAAAGSRRARGRVAATHGATAAASPAGARRGTAPSRAGRRTVPLAAQRIRATSARHELKGRPSFAEIVEAGFMRPGPHRFHVGNVEVAAAVGDDGAILYGGTRYRAISKFALVVLRERNPTRQSCDGWKEVSWCGEKLDALRVRVQAHVRQAARARGQ